MRWPILPARWCPTFSAFVCNTFIEWARFLQQEIPNLQEEDALQLVYRFYGVRRHGVAGGPSPHTALTSRRRWPIGSPRPTWFLRDLVKAKLYLPADMPSYPIIHGEGWPPEAIDRIVSEARRLGHNGIVWQGTEETDGVRLQALRKCVKSSARICARPKSSKSAQCGLDRVRSYHFHTA